MKIDEMTDEELEAATCPPNALPFSPMPGMVEAQAVIDARVTTQASNFQPPKNPNPFDEIPKPQPPAPAPRSTLKQYAVENETPATKFLVAKLPPQARLIYLTAVAMHGAGKRTFSAKDLTDECVKAGLQTRQLPERIINYYLPRLRKDLLFI